MPEPAPLTPDRADKFLVASGHFESRAAARAAIEAGRVAVNGVVLRRVASTLQPGDTIIAAPAHPWVSRGGVKLAHALDVFDVDVSGKICLDIGASTGGFSQVLLERGAAHVYAVDVGHGQLHPRLADAARLTNFERRDARSLVSGDFSAPPQIVVCDASFISLVKLLDVPLALAAPSATLVALFKPQFEAGRAAIGKGGLVTDPAATEAAANALSDWLNEKGWPIQVWTASPIAGGDGNAERLFVARKT